MQGAVIYQRVKDAQILLRPIVKQLAGHGGVLLALLNAKREQPSTC
jgi:hypothetical protein